MDIKRIRFIPIRVVLTLVLLLAALGILPTTPALAAIASVRDSGTSDLLQATSGGHVLGFQPGAMVVSNGTYALRVEFLGAADVAPKTSQEDAGAPARSGQAALPLTQVTYRDLWPGVSLRYDAGGGILRSTYTLAPGADPGAIRLRYNVPVAVDAGGGLVARYESGEVRESAPIAWQEIDGQRTPVPVAFQVSKDSAVSFHMGTYDPTCPLTIDPTLTWNTFLGGSVTDFGQAIAVDGSGNVYVAGDSQATWGSLPVRPHTTGNFDAFAAKLDSSGNLIWNTFLGGSSFDHGRAIAVDGSGNVYVAGYSGAAWGSPVRGYTAWIDTFAAELDSSGNLTWHAFLGGSSFDYGRAIAVDASGDVYVVGTSSVAWGSPVRPHTASWDAFAAKLDGSGNLIWNAFLGGSGADYGYGITVDGGGNVYVTGDSDATWGSPVRAYTADRDAFAAKLDTDGSLTWNTFLGEGGTDYGYGIAVDRDGNVYVAGISSATWGSPVRPYTGGWDVLATELDSSGNLIWHTFLGGSSLDQGFDITVGGDGDVYVTGSSQATWGSPVRPYNSGADAFVARIPSDKTYADSEGVCDGNLPCYTSFQTALDNVMTTGTVMYYPCTFNESVSLTENVTATYAGVTAATIDGSLTISAGTFSASSDRFLLTGDLTRSGGTFDHNGGTFIFAGSGVQTITGDFAFNDLTVNSGATMDAGTNTVTVDGTLTNNGVVRQSRDVSGTGLLIFNLTNVQIDVTTQGSLSGLQTDWVESDHPNSPPGYTVARYWSITPTGSGYTVDLTLPHDSFSDPYVCRHVSGTSWDCGRASFTGSTVTRAGVDALSDWAVYYGNPTAVTLASFAATWDGDAVQVAWETALEIDTVGFNVWRSTAPDGVYVRVNGSLIPSTSLGSVFGASYSYVDEGVIPGGTYYYKLEELEVSGGRNWYGPTVTAGDGPTAAMLASFSVASDGTALWTWGALALGVVVTVAGGALIRWRRV